MKAPSSLLAAIEVSLNRYLELDPESPKRLKTIEGKVIAIELRGMDLCFYLLPDSHGIQVMGEYEGEADTRLSGSPLALLQMGISNHAEKALFSGEVEISGDIELGQEFKKILDGLDIDWEEHLSHITGDVIAHQFGRFVKGVSKWGEKAVETLAMDVTDYLQEEKRLVATHSEVERFNAEVDRLRSDTDRLEARVKRIMDKLADNVSSKKVSSREESVK